MAQICPNHGPSPSKQWPIVLLTEHFLGTVVQRPKFGETRSVAIFRFGNDRSRGWSLTIHNSAQKILINKLTVCSNFFGVQLLAWPTSPKPQGHLSPAFFGWAKTAQASNSGNETPDYTRAKYFVGIFLCHFTVDSCCRILRLRIHQWPQKLRQQIGAGKCYIYPHETNLSRMMCSTKTHYSQHYNEKCGRHLTHLAWHRLLNPTLCRSANCGPQNPLTSHQIQLRCPMCPWVPPQTHPPSLSAHLILYTSW